VNTINILPEHVRNRISAGEVLERPCSAIKELVENSIDAGANRVRIEIRDGGTSFMKVTDNGCGISSEDLPVAVLRHATSKISDVDDIFKITSKGFRGEALPSIASVSRMKISSAVDGEDGNLLDISGGDIVSQQPCSQATGTDVEISDLFYNTPARRKFLKSFGAETAATREMLTRLALSHPEVGVSFVNNGKTVFDISPHNDILSRINSLFKSDTTDILTEVNFAQKDDIQVSGFTSIPPEGRATGKSIYTFVNRRWISHPSLNAVIRKSYEGVLPPRRFPVSFIFIALNPEEIDVNVHPTKFDIRFHQERMVLGAVRRAIIEGIRGARPSDCQIHGFDETANITGVSGEAEPVYKKSYREPEKLAVQRENFPDQSIDEQVKTSIPVIVPDSDGMHQDKVSGSTGKEESSLLKNSISSLASKAPDISEPSKNQQKGFFSEEETPRSSTRIIDQIFDSYLVLEAEEGVMFVDQHALHERIIYEELKKKKDEIVSQQLLVPAIVELSPDEFRVYLELKNELEGLGFGVDTFGDTTVSVNAIPAVVRKVKPRELIRDTISELEQGSVSPSNIREPLIKMMACKAAIKAGDRLPDGEVLNLIKMMNEKDIPLTCPHGRPFAFVLSESEIRRRFERT
jgi:DNA mismatch repair protein MutL